MQLYRFSPIKSGQELREVVAYIAEQNSTLCKKVTGDTLPITSLTVFAHYPDEYEYLCSLLETLGKSVGENNGPRVALKEPIKAGAHTVTHLRIRNPDPYRAQVGCNDFEVENYAKFKETYLATHPENLRLLVRPEYELIEFFDPDYDVLGYVLSQPERSLRGV